MLSGLAGFLFESSSSKERAVTPSLSWRVHSFPPAFSVHDQRSTTDFLILYPRKKWNRLDELFSPPAWHVSGFFNFAKFYFWSKTKLVVWSNFSLRPAEGIDVRNVGEVSLAPANPMTRGTKKKRKKNFNHFIPVLIYM